MDQIEVYKDASGEFRWRRKAPNGEVVADSGEGYEKLDGALQAAHREAETAEVEVDVAEYAGEDPPADE